MQAMVDIVDRFRGTLHGFAALLSPDWNRPEIVFAGYRIPLGADTLEGLFHELGSIPTCFDEVEPGVWRFWWDEEPHDRPEVY